MSKLELLVLASSTAAEEYITIFSDIIDHFNIAKSSLLLAH